jgi:hypothetical protein
MPVSEKDDFNYIIMDIFLRGGDPDPSTLRNDRLFQRHSGTVVAHGAQTNDL